jgi:hypothetical protein
VASEGQGSKDPWVRSPWNVVYRCLISWRFSVIWFVTSTRICSKQTRPSDQMWDHTWNTGTSDKVRIAGWSWSTDSSFGFTPKVHVCQIGAVIHSHRNPY